MSDTIETFRPELPAVTYTYRGISKITPYRDWTVFSSVFSLPENEFDMEQGLTLMTDNLQEAIDMLAPDRAVTPRKQTSPWINAELRLLISTRRHQL